MHMHGMSILLLQYTVLLIWAMVQWNTGSYNSFRLSVKISFHFPCSISSHILKLTIQSCLLDNLYNLKSFHLVNLKTFPHNCLHAALGSISNTVPWLIAQRTALFGWLILLSCNQQSTKLYHLCINKENHYLQKPQQHDTW